MCIEGGEAGETIVAGITGEAGGMGGDEMHFEGIEIKELLAAFRAR